MSPSRDQPSSGSSTPKIAIKGFSLSSKPSAINNTKPKSAPLSSTLGKRARTHSKHFGHADSASDSEDGIKHEVVTGFGHQGAIKRDEERGRREEKVLIIPRMGNRDWRAEARKAGGGGRNLLPPEVQAQIAGERKERENGGKGKEDGVDVVNGGDGEIHWGLTVRKRVEVPEGEGGDEGTNGHIEAEEEKVEEKPKTADEEALAALLGDDKGRKGPDLIIPTLISEPKMSEESAYRLAVANAPDASTLEDYERIPVEEFGAAMLRGMGWKGEENSSDKAGKGKEVKRRQNLLGLGAKELKDAEELGAWVQKSDVKRLKSGGNGGRERRPQVGEYRRERDERRYKEGGYRESERDRQSERDRDGRRERDRHSERDHRDRRR